MSNQIDNLKTNGTSNGTKIDKVFSKITIIACICYVSVILTIFMLTNEEVTKPYMDEIFHIDQIRSYCGHNFTYVCIETFSSKVDSTLVYVNNEACDIQLQWNQKITTPPGLYLTTLGVLKPFSELYAFGEEDAAKKCPVFMIRFVNLVFASGNAYLMYIISLHSHRFTTVSWQAWW